MIQDNSLKYFCKHCWANKPAADPPVIQPIRNKKDERKNNNENSLSVKIQFGRKLICGHFVRTSDQGYKDLSPSLSEYDQQAIRRENAMRVKDATKEQASEIILLWTEQYQLLLKVSLKQVQIAKHNLLELDKMREKLIPLMDPEQVKVFDQKFYGIVNGASPSTGNGARETTHERVKETKERIKKLPKPIQAAPSLADMAAKLARSKGFDNDPRFQEMIEKMKRAEGLRPPEDKNGK